MAGTDQNAGELGLRESFGTDVLFFGSAIFVVVGLRS